ncbi:MAG: UvrD-helicase domain-containing protein [Clostridia bacterium]|nr:UvrD-helicase domain-containing protein [Clostridia bacterium]
MADIRHPALREERAHLDETLSLVAAQLAVGEEELIQAQHELKAAFTYDRDNRDVLELRNLLFERAQQTVRHLKAARLKPYFTRINFTEETGEKQVYYIGKHTVMKSDTLEPEVVDWRAPIANLYYSGQIGPMHYVTPDGEVRGELTLKRQLGIENGELQTIFDTDVVGQEAYLQSVLGATTGDRLRDIVTSIQAEQNFVIRYPLDRSLVVQGVAGSGKTTIALHRIAYLLYTFRDRLEPEHVLILAPNPLFLNFIAGVLPDLGVEKVRQTTFARFVADWLDELLPRVNQADLTDKVLSLPEEERDRLTRLMRFKGSLEMTRRLSDWLDQVEARMPPDEDVRFGPVTLFTAARLKALLLEDEKPFPLNRRLAEFRKELTSRTKDAAAKVKEWLKTETDRRVDLLRSTLPEGESRRLRLVKLYESRDQRLKETDQKVKPFIESVMARFPAFSPIQLYRDFCADLLAESPEGSDAALAAEYTLDRVSGNRIDPEDVALVGLIAMRTHELPRLDIRHVVVDEAQDFSMAEFLLLHRMTRGATMTVVGDLMQGIRSWRGMTDWRPLTEGLFAGKAASHQLLTSYRSTIEIMNLALRAARKRPVPGQENARPVLRHGPEPELIAFARAEEQEKEIERIVRAWRADGLKSIAVIDRTTAQLKALAQALPEDLNARLLDVDAAEFEAGLLLARASDVKGFEFDGVILANASAKRFPDRELDARLLYVCLTRPLHRIACLYERQITPLLD